MTTSVDQTGSWTDYIYANGQKIARLPGSETRLHRQATTSCLHCGEWTALYTPVTLHGHVIQQGTGFRCRSSKRESTLAGVGVNLAQPQHRSQPAGRTDHRLRWMALF